MDQFTSGDVAVAVEGMSTARFVEEVICWVICCI